jgi:four helix bundle protein
MVKTHRDLLAWQKGMALAKAVYEATKAFPKEELFGLTSQIRRAAVSVPANIAEGSGRGSTKEFLQFLMIARGSLAEVETLLLLAKDLSMVSGEAFAKLEILINEISALIGGLIASLRRRSAVSASLTRNSTPKH